MYVIYDSETKAVLRMPTPHRGSGTVRTDFATERAAKAGLTRWMKRNPNETRDWRIVSKETFYSFVDALAEKTNLMTGEKFETSVNTPAFLDPSKESYWSA